MVHLNFYTGLIYFIIAVPMTTVSELLSITSSLSENVSSSIFGKKNQSNDTKVSL